MPLNNYSKDVWDYLGDMPNLPTRRDRDELLALAKSSSKNAKRPAIWDYFFHIRAEDVGKPQLQEIDALTRKKDETVADLKAKARQQSIMAGGVAVVAGLGALVAFWLKQQPIEIGLFALMVLGIVGLSIVWQGSRRQVTKTIRAWNKETNELRKSIVLLQRQIPSPATVDQINRWLEDDIEWLADHALDQTGLKDKLVSLGTDLTNPICIIGPAHLQRSKSIPTPFFDPRETDRGKHIAISRLDFFSDKRFVDLYGVYYVEFIIIAPQVMGNYGCYFDFISGKIYNEHTSEIYYTDVVALTTRKHYHKVDLPFFKMVLENTPTFSIALANGTEIQVAYASSEYIRNWYRALTLSPNGEFGYDASKWVRNPEINAEQTIQILRTQLRRHKGNDTEGNVVVEKESE